MKILLFGGTGNLGRVFLSKALEANHEVTVICRSPEKLNDFKHENLIVMVGDATKLDECEECFSGKDAVVSCLGEYRIPLFRISLHSDFVTALIPKLKKFDIKKFVVCSSNGTIVSERKNAPYLFQWVVYPLISSVLANMLEMEEILKASDVNYVVVRPTHFVTTPGTQKYVVEECSYSTNLGSCIPLEDIAHFFLVCLSSNEYDRKMVAIGSK